MTDWERLKEKGWTSEEILRAKRMMEEDDSRSKLMNKWVYWIALIFAIVANFLVNVALIPVLITFDSLALFATLVLVGVSFGILFTLILKDIELVDPQHHVIAGIFLPILAGIVSYVTVRLSNQLAIAVHTDLLVTQSTLFVPIVYILAFTLPYLISVKRRVFF